MMEFQLSSFKSWKMMLWKCCTLYAIKFGKLSSGHRTRKGQFSFQSQRKAMPKNIQTTAQLHSFHMLATRGFPCSSVGKESACSTGDLSLIPGLGRSPGEGNGNPIQYPYLENLMDRGPWRAAVHGVFQARILDWVAISFSRGSSWPRDRTWISCIGRQILYLWATREAAICVGEMHKRWKDEKV